MKGPSSTVLTFAAACASFNNAAAAACHSHDVWLCYPLFACFCLQHTSIYHLWHPQTVGGVSPVELLPWSVDSMVEGEGDHCSGCLQVELLTGKLVLITFKARPFPLKLCGIETTRLHHAVFWLW